MRYISLFSGIEAASVAWEPLGWIPVAFSEIEPFCCDLLQVRFPNVPNLGDVSKIDWKEYQGGIDVLIGGSPCQAFSIAGRRGGLMDERGRLMLEYVRAVRETRPRFIIWENVPGVLSQDGGRAFATLQRELQDCGYQLAWRVLDSQFFGVAQRRRRVFLVGHPRIGSAAAVLFEPESMHWEAESSKDKRKALAEARGIRAQAASWALQGNSINRGEGAGPNGCGVSEEICYTCTATDQHAVVTMTFDDHQMFSKVNRSNAEWNDPCHTIVAGSVAVVIEGHVICVADDTTNAAIDDDLCGTVKVKGAVPMVVKDMSARYLMPVEIERLFGFPDGWTDLGDTPDTHRYRALGNSMAVPVIRWLGERIEAVDAL